MARTGGDAASKQRMQYRGLRGWLEQVDKMGEPVSYTHLTLPTKA